MNAERFRPEQTRLLALTFIPVFATMMSVSSVNIVLSAMAESLDAGEAQLQWVLAGFTLSLGIVLVPAGRAGDIFGPANLFVLGNVCFGLGSLITGLAPNAAILIAARVVMGIGAGILSTQTLSLLQQNFHREQRGRAFGYYGGIVGVAVAIGPTLGGLSIAALGSEWGWRATFLINVVISAFAVIMAKPWMPAAAWMRKSSDPEGNPRRLDLDPIGALLLCVGVVSIMLPFVEKHLGVWVWGFLGLAAVVLVCWVLWERQYRDRGNAPIVDLSLFQTRSFANGFLISAVYFIGGSAVWVLIALYVHDGLGYSALLTGLVTLPSAIATAVTSTLIGKHIMRIGRLLVIAGVVSSVISMVGAVVFAMLAERHDISLWWLAAVVTFFGAGQALIISPNQTLALADVPLKHSGSAGGVLQTGQRVGTSISLSAVTGVVFAANAASGSWSHGFQVGMWVIASFMVFVLALNQWDIIQSKRVGKAAESDLPQNPQS